MEQQEAPQLSLEQQADQLSSSQELQDIFNQIDQIKGNPEEVIDNVEPETENETENKTDSQDIDEDIDDNDEVDREVDNEGLKEKKAYKYRKLQNDKYRALAEKEAALEKAARLEEMLKESLNSGTYHYGKSVYAEVDKAKEAKKKAFEEGDLDSYMEADVALIKAISNANELEKWAYENENNNQHYYNAEPTYNQPVNDRSVYEEIANDWLDSHPYLQPNSRNFNPTIYNNVLEFTNNLDNNLRRRNQEDMIFSEEYFEVIDNHISSLKRSNRNNSKNIESISNVSGVRNYTSPDKRVAPNNALVLTEDEKRMAINLGVDPKVWLKNKIEQQQVTRRGR